MRQLTLPAFPNYTDLKVEDIELLMEGILKMAETIGKAMGVGSSMATILWGCKFTFAFGGGGAEIYDMTAGAIHYNGEVFFVDAYTFNGTATLIPTFTVAEEDDPTDAHKLQDGTPFVVRKRRYLELSVEAVGAGDFQYDRVLANNTLLQASATEWKALSLINGWSGSVFYRKTIDGWFELRGSLDSTFFTNIKFSEIPSAELREDLAVVRGVQLAWDAVNVGASYISTDGSDNSLYAYLPLGTSNNIIVTGARFYAS